MDDVNDALDPHNLIPGNNAGVSEWEPIVAEAASSPIQQHSIVH